MKAIKSNYDDTIFMITFNPCFPIAVAAYYKLNFGTMQDFLLLIVCKEDDDFILK